MPPSSAGLSFIQRWKALPSIISFAFFFFILQAAPGKSSVQMILDLSILLRALTHCVNSLSFISEEQSNQAGDKAKEADLYSSTSGSGTRCNLSRLALIYFCCCCRVKSLWKSFYMRTAHRGSLLTWEKKNQNLELSANISINLNSNGLFIAAVKHLVSNHWKYF